MGPFPRGTEVWIMKISPGLWPVPAHVGRAEDFARGFQPPSGLSLRTGGRGAGNTSTCVGRGLSLRVGDGPPEDMEAQAKLGLLRAWGGLRPASGHGKGGEPSAFSGLAAVAGYLCSPMRGWA